LLVVDDGSDDTDYARIAVAEVHCDRKRLIRHAVNRGVAAARNTGIAEASGALLTFLDDDDELNSKFLSITAAALSETEPHRAASWSPLAAISTHYLIDVGQFRDERNELVAFLSSGAGCGLTIKVDCLGAIGGFEEALRIGEDTELFVRFLAAGYRPVRLPHNLVNVARGSRGSLTDSAANNLKEDISRWIRVSYADFFVDHPYLRDLLVGDSLSVSPLRLAEELTE
jgi:glycosyltransferase involved in cell wall biosynthesis